MHQLTIERFPVGKLTLRQRMGRDAGQARALKAERISLVTEYRTRVPFICFRPQASMIACKSLPLPEMIRRCFYAMTTRCSESEALIYPIFHAFSPLSLAGQSLCPLPLPAGR